jgi:carboxymethylenebutenolidase
MTIFKLLASSSSSFLGKRKRYACFIFIIVVILGWFIGETSSLSLLPLSSSSLTRSALHIINHIQNNPTKATEFIPLDEIANTKIPSKDGYIQAFITQPSTSTRSTSKLPVLIVIHEFFGLNLSIKEKAVALAEELNCVVVAPDTFRGISTNFIPRAIWLALTTSQNQVNHDLDTVVEYISSTISQADLTKVAIMGFCYGGGKAIRYTLERRPTAATVIFYGNPVTETDKLRTLKGPVLGIYGKNDIQYPLSLLHEFRQALEDANIRNQITVYDNVGHAFWSNMDQIRRKEEPQYTAYQQCTRFLKQFFGYNNNQ